MSGDSHPGAREGPASANNPIVSSELHESADLPETANNVNPVGVESLPLALQAVLNEMRDLTQALKASGRLCNCHAPEPAKKSLTAAGTDEDQQQNPQSPGNDSSEGGNDRSKFEREVSLLRSTHDVLLMQKAKDLFLSWLKNADIRISWLDPDFRAEFQPEPSEQIRAWFDTVWDRGYRESANNHRMSKSQWAPNIAVSVLKDEAEHEYRQIWACPPGRIWWITDNWNSSLRMEVGKDKTSPKTIMFSMVTLLVQCFINPAAEHFIHWTFRDFVSAYSDFFQVRSVRSRSSSCYYRRSTLRLRRSFALQYHLRYFSPLRSTESVAPSHERLSHDPFIRKRQVAWIGPRAESTNEKGPGESYFKERAISISLIMWAPRGAFQLVFLCDEGTGITERSWHAHDNSTAPEGFNQAPGLGHFVSGMKGLIESWHHGWNDTLGVIDGAVGFKMDHTKDDHGLDKFMFDDAGFMKLSKRYFTVLQLLRMARQWIDDNAIEWEEFCNAETSLVPNNLRNFLRDTGCDENFLQSWDDQRDKLTQLFKSQAQQLRDRIDRKSEEVKSLRDGLFSATSLREATKGMALNRAIYVFTAVTVIYTPLGFVSALWALPILNTTAQGENTHPSLPTFVASFVLVPILTYFICGGLAWYYTSRNSKRLVQDTSNLARDRFRNMFSREEAAGLPK